MTNKPHQYEFFGPTGALFITTMTPLFLVLQGLYCNIDTCSLSNLKNMNFDLVLGFKIFLTYMAYLVALHFVLPGKIALGLPLTNNKARLEYKLNSFNTLILTTLIVLFLFLYSSKTVYDLTYLIITNFSSILFASIICSFSMSLVLYLYSYRKNATILENSDSYIYTFFMGRELNPRIYNMDIKFFLELRPGLIGWVIINFSYLVNFYIKNQTLTFGLGFIFITQFWYVIDALYNEEKVLSTMDIITDNLGFMLVFGNLSYVPFFYTIQIRFAYIDITSFNGITKVIVCLIYLIGYYIFRKANMQKHFFRLNPLDSRVKNLKSLETRKGTKLLVDGMWKYARHINYLGDWMMSLAQCMACGLNSFYPYLYVVYFAILLIHRENRDSLKCSRKYGKDWEKYKELVPYKIIPYFY